MWKISSLSANNVSASSLATLILYEPNRLKVFSLDFKDSFYFPIQDCCYFHWLFWCPGKIPHDNWCPWKAYLCTIRWHKHNLTEFGQICPLLWFQCSSCSGLTQLTFRQRWDHPGFVPHGCQFEAADNVAWPKTTDLSTGGANYGVGPTAMQHSSLLAPPCRSDNLPDAPQAAHWSTHPESLSIGVGMSTKSAKWNLIYFEIPIETQESCHRQSRIRRLTLSLNLSAVFSYGVNMRRAKPILQVYKDDISYMNLLMELHVSGVQWWGRRSGTCVLCSAFRAYPNPGRAYLMRMSLPPGLNKHPPASNRSALTSRQLCLTSVLMSSLWMSSAWRTLV